MSYHERPVKNIAVNLARSSPVPLYHQLARLLEASIQSGEIAKGEFLNNELELVELWQVSRPTVRRAIQDLVDTGLVVRRRGVGTQVVSDQIRRPVQLTSLYEDLKTQGRTPKTKVLVHARRRADPAVAKALNIAKGSEIIYIERVRSAGNTGLAILRNTLLLEAAGAITTQQLETSGLYELLRSKGVRPRVADEIIGAKLASVDEAAALGLKAGAALVTMHRVMQDDTGRTVEVGSHVYDATKYTVEITVVAN
jgi:DNA-binding GntR family transcriptional regulator